MKTDHICKECGKHENGNWFDDCAKKLIENQMCFSCDFWHDLFLIKDQKNVVRIDGSHYMIGPINNNPAGWKGFGGTKFKIKFNDGREIKTDNLWHQGAIPDHWQKRLSDNAKFIKN